MSERPIIGIISRTIPFYHRERPYPRYGVAINYCRGVELAGGTPVILPMTQDKVTLDSLYGILDGLLLPGGQDVDPHQYGEEPHRRIDSVDPLRDLTEIHLARRALTDDMPIFGICRGCQVLNVAAGGTLYQDLHAQYSEESLRHFQDYAVEWASHGISVKEGSRLRELIGEGHVLVNSYHHQAVKRIAEGFSVTAVASDGVVEAIESERHTWVLGVQWHPELLLEQRDFNLAFFRRHIEMAAQYKAQRSAARA